MSHEISDDSFYMSAPTSPHRLNLDNMYFYSVPTSPTKVTYDFAIEPTTPKTYEDASSNLDDFEFETSRRFVDDYDFETSDDWSEQKQEKVQKQRKELLPAMAFADELFCDGKVMPLKPPPRTHCINYNKKFGNHSSTPVSPKSPTSVQKFPFSRRSLWNDDFDPFMVALQNVMNDETRERRQEGTHRRAWSVLPLRANSDIKPNTCNHGQCKYLNSVAPNPNQQIHNNKLGSYNPSPTSSKSPALVPFPEQDMWTDDFDPFTVAFETVKEENRCKCRRINYRGSWSLLPSWTATDIQPSDLMGRNHLSNHLTPNLNKQMEPNGSYRSFNTEVSPQQPKEVKDIPKSPIKLAEPKGVVYARKTRLVKMEQEGPKKPKADGSAKKSGWPWPYFREKKRQWKKGFMFRSSSPRKTSNEDEQMQTDKDMELSKPKIMKKSSSKKLGSNEGNEEKVATQMNKLTLVQSRPKLLLCMGFGAKYAQ